MKKYLQNLIFIIFILICQLSLGIIFPSLNLIPDFILIYIILNAVVTGSKNAMIYAFTGGILQDVFLGSFIGIFTPVKTASAFLAGLLSRRFFPENLLIPPIGVFAATIVHEILYLVLKESYFFNTNYLVLLNNIILPLAALNALIAFVAYLAYYLWGGRYS